MYYTYCVVYCPRHRMKVFYEVGTRVFFNPTSIQHVIMVIFLNVLMCHVLKINTPLFNHGRFIFWNNRIICSIIQLFIQLFSCIAEFYAFSTLNIGRPLLNDLSIALESLVNRLLCSMINMLNACYQLSSLFVWLELLCSLFLLRKPNRDNNL